MYEEKRNAASRARGHLRNFFDRGTDDPAVMHLTVNRRRQPAAAPFQLEIENMYE